MYSTISYPTNERLHYLIIAYFCFGINTELGKPVSMTSFSIILIKYQRQATKKKRLIQFLMVEVQDPVALWGGWHHARNSSKVVRVECRETKAGVPQSLQRVLLQVT